MEFSINYTLVLEKPLPRIIVNAAFLKNIASGIGRYIRELYLHLQQLHLEFEIRYFDGNRIREKMPVPPQSRGPGVLA